MAKKVLILPLSIFIWSYVLIHLYDDEVVKIRFERHGAYGYAVFWPKSSMDRG